MGSVHPAPDGNGYVIKYDDDTLNISGDLSMMAYKWSDANTSNRKPRLSGHNDILTYDCNGNIVTLADYGEHTDLPAAGATKKRCAYCGSTSPDDRRGNCADCGGPRI